jgi:enediyne biosynthesis protein E4
MPRCIVRCLYLGLVLGAVVHCPAQIFREAPASETKITWTHHSGRSEHRYLPEVSGPGVAIFDYNNDGWMDLLFVDSGTSSFYKPATPLRAALYRNNHDGTFTDVTLQAGLTTDIFGQGVAIGDYDGDGYQDIFITGYGKCVLYHNNGNGTFTDVTAQSGIAPPRWGTTAVWFDYDNDGKLDLFIGEFADYSSLKVCQLADSYGGAASDDAPQTSHEAYTCTPKIFPPVASHLYRNLGNGHFADVSVTTGIASAAGKAWGAVATDIDGDGFTDLFVANDTMENFLWRNHGGKEFEEIGLDSGVGYSSEGLPRSGMGVDAGDFDGDGKPQLLVTNIDTQCTSLYKNIGQDVFEDLNLDIGLAAPTRMVSGWGLRLFDYDNDGFLDLIQVNGYPDDRIDERHRGVSYREPLFLFHNVKGTKLDNVSNAAGPAFQQVYAGRGLAVGDLNNDGYPDFVFTENNGPPHVLMNTGIAGNNWLGLDLKATKSNPAAVGAVIRWRIGAKTHTRIKSAGGFLSSQDPRELLGAGKNEIDWVEVQWPAPSHSVDRIEKPAMNRYLRVVEKEHSYASAKMANNSLLTPVHARLIRTALEDDDVASLWQKAKSAMDQRNFGEARTLLRQAVKLDPNDGSLWFHLGASCAELNDLDEAIHALERARALAPKEADTYFNLGLLYWRKGELTRAKDSYREGLRLRPNEPEGLRNYGLLLMKTGEYGEATAPLSMLRNDATLGVSARVALMECYLKTGKKADAEQEANGLIADKTVGPEDQTKIAAVLLQEGDADAAEILFRNSLSQNPNQANANAALGEICLNKRQLDDAAALFTKAMQLSPDSADYAFGYVRVLLAEKDSSHLLTFLKSVEGKFHDLPNYQYALARAYYGELNYPETIRVLDDLLKTNPPRPDKIEDLMGNSYQALGNMPEAESAFQKAIEINPKNPEYYVSSALVLRREGPEKTDEAIAQLTKAERISPGDWRLELQLGLCYEEKNRFADAAELIEKSVQARPDMLPAHVALARIYFRLGRKADHDREKKIIAELEKTEQQQRVQQFATDSLIEDAPQPATNPAKQ